MTALGVLLLALPGCSDPDEAPANAPDGDTSASEDPGPEPDAPASDADAGEPDGAPDADAGPTWCDPPVPPEEALRKAQVTDDLIVLPGGRTLTPAGKQVTLGGFPVDVRMHPTLPVAYVSNTGYGERSIQVIDLEAGTLLQQIDRDESWYGLAVSPDGARVYAAGGDGQDVDAYAVQADGSLEQADNVALGGFPGGMTMSADGSRLYVGRWLEREIAELDPLTLEVLATHTLFLEPYSIVELPSRNELWVTAFGERHVMVVDLLGGEPELIEVPGGNPLDIAVTPGEDKVYVTLSDGDVVVAIDTATRALVGTAAVGELDMVDDEGKPLPASSPAGIWLDSASKRLFVARSADNAVSILDPETLETSAAIPVAWYPTAIGYSATTDTLVVANAKGIGAGALYNYGFESGKAQMTGTASVIDLGAVDLPAATEQVRKNITRPRDIWQWQCEGIWPVPAEPGGPTPIEHIVLIVRENKTYDSILGDADLPGADADPEQTLYGEDVVPNIRALARTYANHDNFYNDGETSVQGHLWLTASYVNPYMERTWLEGYRGNPGFDQQETVADRGQPDFGTFFTHLIKHGVDFTNFGEVVGTFAEYEGTPVTDFVDLGFPGLFYNLDVKDEEKARYVVKRLVEDEDFPPFVFVLIPNDHTKGLGASSLTPESMISDNDYATGLIVEGISKSKFWDKTAIFIVQDDTQIGGDHVDYHRSILVIASPWAKRATSHVHTSFPSLFRTFELILGLPPLNRLDAHATPLWDAFTSEPNPAPFTALERRIPDITNGEKNKNKAPTILERWSEMMDFTGPDRNEDLGAVLWMARKGSPPPGSRLAKVLSGELPPDAGVEYDEDDQEEIDIFDEGWRRTEAWLEAHPELKAKADLRPRPKPPAKQLERR